MGKVARQRADGKAPEPDRPDAMSITMQDTPVLCTRGALTRITAATLPE